MTNRIRAGAMLVEEGTIAPEPPVFDTEQYSVDWSSILKSSAAQLDKDLQGAGWTFEITQVRRRSFFGLPYTSLIARARHIQRGRMLHDPSGTRT